MSGCGVTPAAEDAHPLQVTVNHPLAMNVDQPSSNTDQLGSFYNLQLGAAWYLMGDLQGRAGRPLGRP